MPDSQNFPSTKSEVLTMLYLSKKEYKNISPEDIAKDYLDAHARIREALRFQKEQRKRD